MAGRVNSKPEPRVFDPEAMDSAAGEAAAELDALENGAVQVMAQWWAKWYLRTGHKRLGRILVARAKGEK